MQPTVTILDRIMRNSRNDKEEIFTRLYRYMLRPDMYYLAYNKLYRNKGASTKGRKKQREHRENTTKSTNKVW